MILRHFLTRHKCRGQQLLVQADFLSRANRSARNHRDSLSSIPGIYAGLTHLRI